MCLTVNSKCSYYLVSTYVVHLSMTQTFALAGTEAATFLARGGWALVNGQGLLVTLTARDFTMHLVGQVPQQTHAVLYQLQKMERKQLGLEKRRTHNPLELKTT